MSDHHEGNEMEHAGVGEKADYWWPFGLVLFGVIFVTLLVSFAPSL